jgi:hypothetical protein
MNAAVTAVVAVDDFSPEEVSALYKQKTKGERPSQPKPTQPKPKPRQPKAAAE